MAARKVRYEFESKNFQAVDGNFDKLTKKEQEAIVKGSKLGAVLEKTGNKAKKTGKKGGDAFGGMAAKMAGVIGTTQLISKAIGVANDQYEKMLELQSRGSTVQKAYAESIGKIADNMRTTFTPEKRVEIESFIKDQGKLLGEGGVDVVASALADVTSLVGTTDFTEDEIKKAVAYQVNLKAKGLPVDIAAGASANIDLAKQAGISNRQAENVIAGFGEQAGGTAALFSPIVPSLLATASSVGMTPTEVMALAGFISQELKSNPAETATIVKNLIGKADPLRLEKLGIVIEADTRFLQVIEIMKRATSGEFGSEKFKALTAAGVKGAHAPGVSYKIASKSEKLLEREESLRRLSTAEGDVSLRAASALGVQAKMAEVGKAIAGGREVALTGDTELSIRKAKVDILKSIEERFGLTQKTGTFLHRTGLEDMDTISDPVFTTKSALGKFDPWDFIQSLSRTPGQQSALDKVRKTGEYPADISADIQDLIKIIKEERGKAQDTGGQD